MSKSQMTAGWLTDPAGQPLDVVGQVRDDIKARVDLLVTELLGSR